MDKKITVYSTTWCPNCKQAKAYLRAKGIEIVEKNIEDDNSAREELLEKTGGVFLGVPVIEINNELLQGFDQDQIDLALES